MRTVLMTVVVLAAFSAGWLARADAQQNTRGSLITYFSHEKVDASFAKAHASTGSRDLFTRKDRQGRTWAVHSNDRGKADEGTMHSHEDWTAVVVIMSGTATFVTPGTAATTSRVRETADGGQLIGAGESHRVSKGDVVVIPPDTPHMYKEIEEPFRYLVVQTP